MSLTLLSLYFQTKIFANFQLEIDIFRFNENYILGKCVFFLNGEGISS